MRRIEPVFFIPPARRMASVKVLSAVNCFLPGSCTSPNTRTFTRRTLANETNASVPRCVAAVWAAISRRTSPKVCPAASIGLKFGRINRPSRSTLTVTDFSIRPRKVITNSSSIPITYSGKIDPVSSICRKAPWSNRSYPY